VNPQEFLIKKYIFGDCVYQIGSLTQDYVNNGLHDLRHIRGSQNHAFLQFTLQNAGLNDIFLLRNFIHLQRVDISGNALLTLEPLGNLRQLKELYASKNFLKDALDFSPPEGLQVVDLSKNQISCIERCKLHPYLQELYLQGNFIESVDGIFCHNTCLKILDLSNNRISSLRGITGEEQMQLEKLSLSTNKLQDLVGIEKLKFLRTLVAHDNQLNTLQGITAAHHPYLQQIELEQNKIESLESLIPLKDLRYLRALNFLQCPLQMIPFYRLSIIHLFQKLTILDNQPITAEEKVLVDRAYGCEMYFHQQRWNEFLPGIPFADPRIITEKKIKRTQNIINCMLE
ncbi:leucine rich repeat-containing protein, partial [Cardiosporidium cionae]